MPQTNVDLKLFYVAEINYGGGLAGAIYTKTVSTGAADLARVNLLAGDVKMKGKIFKRNRISPPGDELGAGKVVTTGAEFPEIEFSYYLQSAADPFKATAVGGTRGTVGTSYYLQVVGPDPTEVASTVTYSVYGAQMKSYSITGSIDNDKPPLVTVKFSAYAIVAEGFAQTGGLPAGIINEWDDIVVTLDADAITELKSFTLTINFIYFTAGSGRNSTFDKFKPLITDKTLEYQVNFFLDSADLLTDTMTEVLNELVAAWTDGTNTISVTNCHIESDNFLEFTGDTVDGVEYNMTIVSGNSVYS